MLNALLWKLSKHENFKNIFCKFTTTRASTKFQPKLRGCENAMSRLRENAMSRQCKQVKAIRQCKKAPLALQFELDDSNAVFSPILLAPVLMDVEFVRLSWSSSALPGRRLNVVKHMT